SAKGTASHYFCPTARSSSSPSTARCERARSWSHATPLYTAPELRRQLADSGPETLVALSRLHAVARAARDGTPLRNLILPNLKEYFPPILRALFTLARERREGYRTTVDRAAGERFFPNVLRYGAALRPVDVRPA